MVKFRFREEICYLENHWIATALDEYLARLEPDCRKLQRELKAEFPEAISNWNLKLPAMMSEFGKWLKVRLTTELLVISHRERLTFLEPLKKAQSYLTNSIEASRSRLYQYVREALGIELSLPELSIDIPQIEEPPIDVNTNFMVPMDIIGNLIPCWFVKPLLQKNLLRRINEEAEKNISRLASEWRKRVSAGIRQLRSSAISFIENELSTIENIIARTPENQQSLAQIVEEIKEIENSLNEETEVKS